VDIMRTWTYIGGFAVLGWGLLAVATALSVGRMQSWWVWGCGFMGTLSTLTAGAWLTQGTWPYRLIGWFAGLHPVIGLALSLGILVGVIWLTAAMLPDPVMSKASISVSVAVMALFLPALAGQAPLPGRVGHTVTSAVTQVTAETTRVTAGWFG
jgi:hypothetical protein